MSDEAWLEEADWDKKEMKSTTKYSKTSKRYYMKKDTSRKLIFLDAKPRVIFEHNPKIGKSWNNNCTCLKMIADSCSLCAAGNDSYKISMFTVIDTSEWTDKDGKKQSFTKRLYAAKKSTFEKLVRRNEKLEKDGLSLRGAVYTVSRGTDETSPNVGEDFDFEEHLNEDKLKELEVKLGKEGLTTPLDYNTLLKPDASFIDSLAERLAFATKGDTASTGASSPDVKY
jgi:hypothetical protein